MRSTVNIWNMFAVRIVDASLTPNINSLNVGQHMQHGALELKTSAQHGRYGLSHCEAFLQINWGA
jgi:hypothetical protein